MIATRALIILVVLNCGVAAAQYDPPAPPVTWQGGPTDPPDEPSADDWFLTTHWVQGSLPSTVESAGIDGLDPEDADHSARINAPGSVAEAAALFLGSQPGEYGSVRLVKGSLRVAGTGPHAGRLFVGRDGGKGYLFQRWGDTDLYTAKGLLIGSSDANAPDHNSDGHYRIRGGTLTVNGGLQIAPRPQNTGLFEVFGSTATIDVKQVDIGTGAATVHFLADSNGISTVNSEKFPVFDGTLQIDLSIYTGTADLTLFDVTDDPEPGQELSGFDRVMIRNPDAGGFYELTYVGGDGNDVVLLYHAQPVVTYDDWVAAQFDQAAIDANEARPYMDPDADGLTNAAEYVMALSPHRVETANVTGSSGDAVSGWYRTDREYIPANGTNPESGGDARMVPQLNASGTVGWTNRGFTVNKTPDPYWNLTYLDATTSDDGDRRIFFEVLPVRGTEHLNVLFITIDDLNDWVGCMNKNPDTRTPNMDRLAARGTMFQNAHAASTICHPSRVALLSGYYPSTSGVYDNYQDTFRNGFLGSKTTLPEYFEASGEYVAVGSGKIFHDQDDQSWTEYSPALGTGKVREPEPSAWASPISPKINGLALGGAFDWAAMTFGDPNYEPVEEFSDYKVATFVSDWIQARPENQTESFFLGCGIFRPHLPFYAPSENFDQIVPWQQIAQPALGSNELDGYEGAPYTEPANSPLIDKAGDNSTIIPTPGVLDNQKKCVRAYLASINFADDQVGRVLDSLDASPHGRNTIIVLVSDHGWMFGQKTHWRKNALWYDITHVPFIVVAPGKSLPGSTTMELASLVDVFPTLADLAGLSVPARDGRSLVPYIEDQDARTDHHVLVTRHRWQDAVIRSTTGLTERYIRYQEANTPWNPTTISPPTEEYYKEENGGVFDYENKVNLSTGFSHLQPLLPTNPRVRDPDSN